MISLHSDIGASDATSLFFPFLVGFVGQETPEEKQEHIVWAWAKSNTKP